MASDQVFKVKHGETLRRFSVHVDENGFLVIDILTLREKIINFFQFNPDADLNLTYIDGDNDIVTLVDDEDLLEALRQHINPLRIDVQLNTGKNGRSKLRRMENPNPTKKNPNPTKKNPNPIHQSSVLGAVNQALKPVPDPLRGILSNLSRDILSMAVSGAPVLSELVESLSKSGTQQPPPHGHGGSSSEVPADKSNIPLNDANDNMSESSVESASLHCQWTNDEKQGKKCPFMKNDMGTMSNYTDNVNVDLLGCPEESSDSLGMSETFHFGVQCDGCGETPIKGLRFKSKVKVDYDLCSLCFIKIGNESDYTTIDHCSRASQRCHHKWHHGIRGGPHPCRGRVMRRHHSKLDSHFIRDVSILDGTMMIPGTRFTKIWRMCNNGSIAWPPHTTLVWVGGERFSDRTLVELELPMNGCLVGQDIDIAVDFIAPSLPGQYISYWRLSSSSGYRFGQCVWVLVQVVQPSELSSEDSHNTSLSLNLPIERGEPFPDSFIPKPVSNLVSDVAKPSGNREHNESQISMQHPTNSINVSVDTSSSAHSMAAPRTAVEVPSLDPFINVNVIPSKLPSSEPTTNETVFQSLSQPSFYPPVLDLNEMSSELPLDNEISMQHPTNSTLVSNSTSNIVEVPSNPSSLAGSIHNEVEEALLRELDEYGFKQIELNRKFLKKNDYDLELTLDDLCAINEWDPLLDELNEMGFSDRETNIILLLKNRGSIKRVVMDLIAREKGSVVE